MPDDAVAKSGTEHDAGRLRAPRWLRRSYGRLPFKLWWPFYYPRIRLRWLEAELKEKESQDDAVANVLGGARDALSKRGVPVYSDLVFTERRLQWVLLYEHIHRGQIQPRIIRRMQREDIEYMAGMPSIHPDFLATGVDAKARGEGVKIVENVTRATREVRRRDTFRISLIAALVASVIGLIAAVAGRDTAPAMPTLSSQTSTSTPNDEDKLSRALRVLDGRGYVSEDTSTFDEESAFTVLVGLPKGCGAGCPQLAFFFADGEFVGNDSHSPSGSMGIKSQDGDTVILSYGIYEPSDPACCPSGEEVDVRFTWDGSNLLGKDAVPPERLRDAS